MDNLSSKHVSDVLERCAYHVGRGLGVGLLQSIPEQREIIEDILKITRSAAPQKVD